MSVLSLNIGVLTELEKEVLSLEVIVDNHESYYCAATQVEKKVVMIAEVVLKVVKELFKWHENGGHHNVSDVTRGDLVISFENIVTIVRRAVVESFQTVVPKTVAGALLRFGSLVLMREAITSIAALRSLNTEVDEARLVSQG